MDFRSLSRRELQALCKRNKIPANITNVAMAEALAALPLVEGIDEFLNGEGSGVPESPMKEEIGSSQIPRTALKTSTRRKAVKDETVTTRTRRTAAARSTEESENRDLNVALTTPSLPIGRRRTAAASSACKKVDFQMTVDVEKEDNDLDEEKNLIETTPAVPKSQKRVAGTSTRKRTETRNNGATEQRVYSTRRSVRLLEKNMESLSLGEDRKMEPITVHMSFDEMPPSSGPVKEETDLEIESKKTDESESKLDEDLILEIDDQEKNEMESEVKISEVEPEMDLDSLDCSAENLVTAKSCVNSETEVPVENLNVKCFSDGEEANEASKDDDAVEISVEEINDSDKVSLPTEDVDLTDVHNSSIVEESSKEVEQNESICDSECKSEVDSGEEGKLMKSSAELSLSHENVEEEIQVEELVSDSAELSLPEIDDVWSSDEESDMEVKDGPNEHDYESEPTMEEEEEEEALGAADTEEDKKEMDKEMVSVQAEDDDTVKSMEFPENVAEMVSVQAEDDDTVKSMEFPENVAEDLVDVKNQWKMEEAPKDAIDSQPNVDAIDSQPKIPNDIQCEEVLVEVVTSTEETIPTSSQINEVQSLPSFPAEQLTFANQFPRPTVETKSPVKERTTRLLMDNADVEDDEDEKEQEEKANCVERQIMEKFDTLSLRQLKKKLKEQVQVNKKKVDNNSKVVGEGKVRTALQPVPENIMVDESEKRF